MPYVEVESVDGTFRVTPMSDASADSLSMQGGEPLYIEDDVYQAWLAHERERAAFNMIWRQLQNAQRDRREVNNLRTQVRSLEGQLERARKSKP